MDKTEDFPAFPYVTEGGPNSGLHPEIWPGMSLRDWFAGQALAGLCVNQTIHGRSDADAAERAWEVADMMLKKRGEQS